MRRNEKNLLRKIVEYEYTMPLAIGILSVLTAFGGCCSVLHKYEIRNRYIQEKKEFQQYQIDDK